MIRTFTSSLALTAALAAAVISPAPGSAADATNLFGVTLEPVAGSAMALIEYADEWIPMLTPLPSAPQDDFGVKVVLGEADTGLFLYPDTDYQGEAYQMRGMAYGSVNSVTNQPFVEIWGIRTGSFNFNTGANFARLGASSNRFSLYRGSKLVHQYVGSGLHEIEINCSDFWGNEIPRVNPLWRMPDGRFGALIELDREAYFSLSSEYGTSGDRLFIEPLDTTNSVQFVSHVEVYSPEELSYFNVRDVRVGAFGHAHKALGSVHLKPTLGRLTITNLPAQMDEEIAIGVAIELNEPKSFTGSGGVEPAEGAARVDVDFSPLSLGTNTSLRIKAMGIISYETAVGQGDVLGTPQLWRGDGALELRPSLYSTELHLSVRSNGTLVGAVDLPRDSGPVQIAGEPRLVGCGAFARTATGRAGYRLRFDQATSFTLTNGVTLSGNEVQMEAINIVSDPQSTVTWTNAVAIASLQYLLLLPAGIPELAIVDERIQFVTVPSLSIAKTDGAFRVWWPDPNRIFILQTSLNITNTWSFIDFETEANDSELYRSITWEPETENVQYFRLRSVNQFAD